MKQRRKKKTAAKNAVNYCFSFYGLFESDIVLLSSLGCILHEIKVL